MHSRAPHVLVAGDNPAATLLTAALCRSFTAGQVKGPVPSETGTKGFFNVFAGCGACSAEAVRAAVRKGGKILLTGDPGPRLAPLPGLRIAPELSLPPGAASAEHCFTEPFHESPGRISYTGHPLATASPVRDRAFCRYDYAEWNNLGFGAVRAGGDFGVAGGIAADGAATLAAMSLKTQQGEDSLGPYLTLLDLPKASILWCARPVGPLDSVEWQVVERFFSDWRAGDLPCLPYLQQTPRGADCAATMRLDCDEAVASCRDLFELYLEEGVPFSVALKTGQDLNSADFALLRAIYASGGSILSHSHEHAQRWGVDRESVALDVRRSMQWFRENLPGVPVSRLAVSPFHSNPVYAVQGLEDAGIKGFVGGIIDYDPEFLLGRAGRAPFTEKLLSISQQSMLHGDSYHNQGHSLAVHDLALSFQCRARGIFGYLDHPFSERYQYGWDSAGQRLAAHRQFIRAMKARESVVFLSQEECFSFVEALAAAQLGIVRNGAVVATACSGCEWKLQYRFEGEDLEV
ncbi:MAG: hypothetical protein LBQ51_06465 [Desulfovibrio sp.]|jgi:hypothetical protein|nr:hypothetical protein [Desulfovibrio sp.]